MGSLTENDRMRYDRQMMMPGWGEEGQRKLRASRVFVAGAGGLGSPAAIYLAVAGVGHLEILDADDIDLSNLNRQILHPDLRIGMAKTESAAATLRALNPSIAVTAHSEYLDGHNVDLVVGEPDIVVDCLDNFETRYLLNLHCVAHGIPYVHGAVEGWMGQVTFLHPPHTPCLRCLFPEGVPKRRFPVVGATPGIIGSIQAMEVLKHLTGLGATLKGRLLLLDGQGMEFTPIKVLATESCPVCGSFAPAQED